MFHLEPQLSQYTFGQAPEAAEAQMRAVTVVPDLPVTMSLKQI